MNASDRFDGIAVDLADAARHADDPAVTPEAVRRLIPVVARTLLWLREVALAREKRPVRRFLVVRDGGGTLDDFDSLEEAEANAGAMCESQHPRVVDTRDFTF